MQKYLKSHEYFKILIIYNFVNIMFTVSCFSKSFKSTDPDFQYEKAVYYFNNGEYNRSLELLENLLTIYKGTEKSEDIYYYYVYNNFYLKDYISTIFHADNFISNFVSSSRNEEIAFLSAFSHYIDTPRYSLDQKKQLMQLMLCKTLSKVIRKVIV